MALIFSTTGITLSLTGITVTVTHALGVAPDFTLLTQRGTTATGGAAILSSTTQILTICAYGVANGLVDVCAISFHSIIK